MPDEREVGSKAKRHHAWFLCLGGDKAASRDETCHVREQGQASHESENTAMRI